MYSIASVHYGDPIIDLFLQYQVYCPWSTAVSFWLEQCWHRKKRAKQLTRESKKNMYVHWEAKKHVKLMCVCVCVCV